VPIDTKVQLCPAHRDLSMREVAVLYAVDRSTTPTAIAHIKAWHGRASARAGLVDLRRQNIQSKNVEASMSETTPEVADHNLMIFKNYVVGEAFLGAGIKKIVQKRVESALDVHSRIIKESIQATVSHRIQQEQ